VSSRTRILFITGMGRSGSTVLELLLARLDGWVGGGELRRYWFGAPMPGWICGCGRLVAECDFWTGVGSKLAAAGLDPRTYRRLFELERSHLRLRPLPLARLMRAAPKSGIAGSSLNEYQNAMASLYAAVASEAGARVVVDSSKQPQNAYLASWNPGVEMFAVHLVRDPRGVAHSFSKKVPEPQPDLEYMPRSGPFGTALRWSVRHGFVEALLRPRLGNRYMQLRYEDMVRDPTGTVSRVARLVDGLPAVPDAVNGGSVDLVSNHTFSGNPLRLRRKSIEVTSDEAWTRELSSRDQALAALAASALMGRYGYARMPRAKAAKNPR